MELSILHLCLDFTAFKEIFNPDTEEHLGLIETIFNTRKKYANKWECCPFPYPFKHRIVVNGYAVEVNYWNFWFSNQDTEESRQYIQTTLAQTPIRALTAQYLDKLKQQ
ncbi:MAG: hypothetical protein AB4368_33060 [Xenococcaceae cyanobacterium]